MRSSVVLVDYAEYATKLNYWRDSDSPRWSRGDGVPKMKKGINTLESTKITLFKGRGVRKTLYKNEWWFSVVDVIEAVTESDRPRKYWSDLKKKLVQEGYTQLSEKIGQLKLLSADGKYYETDCGDTETMFRIVQSIPSPKAEPFKRWLARVGYERIQEIENRMRGI